MSSFATWLRSEVSCQLDSMDDEAVVQVVLLADALADALERSESA